MIPVPFAEGRPKVIGPPADEVAISGGEFHGRSPSVSVCIRTGRTNPRGLTVYHRLRIFVSTASAAESFRSRCGSVRGAPVCSSQISPIAAPQVLQGTDNICFGVSSLVFTNT